MGFELEFCDSNVIDHFGCDAAPILKITCSDTEFLERFVLVLAALMLLFTLVCVIMSYTSCTLCASPGSSSSSGSKGHPGVWTLACVLAGWGVLEVLPFLYSSQFILSGCSPNMGEGRAVRRGRGHTQCPVAWGHRCPRTCRSSSLCHLWRVFQGHPGTPGGRRRGFCLQMLIPAEAGVPDAGAPVCCHM